MAVVFHQPVLVSELVACLNVKSSGIYLDGTLGTGGHALAVLQSLSPTGLLIGCDQDGEALALAQKRLAEFGERVHFHQTNFSEVKAVLNQEGLAAVDGIYLDLGISALQLESPQRGFSFSKEGPIDMRMNPEAGMTAAQKIRAANVKELEHVLAEYGEERYAKRIAIVLKEKMRSGKLNTTLDLANTIREIYPPTARHPRIHPATRTFQALRIWVNGELEALKEFLEAAPVLLRAGGRLVIIAYHSLEDRMVKQTFRRLAQTQEGFEMITKKPIQASERETAMNPRARSAKLRALARCALARGE